jgi:hypothetical protein
VEYVTTGANATAVDETPAPPGCFSCHAPHEDGNFGLRTTAAVALADGTPFDKGSGNLCASCHLALGVASDEIDSSDYTNQTGTAADAGIDVTHPLYNVATNLVSSHFGPHHGPQGDYLMGINSAITATYVGESVHATGDSCVTCHHYKPDDRMAGNLEWGGHGFYLTSEVHGAAKDLIANCEECHTTAKFKNAPTTDPDTEEGFLYMDDTDPSFIVVEDWDGDGITERVFEEIQGLRDTLIEYFGESDNFLEVVPVYNVGTEKWDSTYVGAVAGVADGIAPLVDVTGQVDVVTGYEWGQGWNFQEAEMNQTQTEAFWNFRFFIEDKSMGIHNPVFAAQILWDAIVHLNADSDLGVSLEIGTDTTATRP